MAPKKKLTPYNRHVQKQMKAGKSMKQAAASWSKKSGKPKAASKSSSKSKASKSKGGNKTMGRRNGFNTQKIFSVIRIAGLGLPAAVIAMGPGTGEQKVKAGVRAYFGFDVDAGTFRFADLAKGWTPYVASILTTYGIPKLAGFLRRFL